MQTEKPPMGAGRPPLPPGRKKTKHTVTLLPAHRKVLLELGNGNMSAGIATMIRASAFRNVS